MIVGFLAAVVSAGVSLLITNKYQSTVIFFPAQNSSLSKAVMTMDAAAKNDISTFGEEEQAEAMLQILNSDNIKWRIWSKYDLMNHYEIDPTGDFANTELGQTWESNVNYKRTEFNSIRIDVLDTDPKMAADIANDIAALVDSTKNKMLRDRASQALSVIENEYNNLTTYMQELDDSLTVLRRKGVQEYDKQIEQITKVYYEAIASNKQGVVRELESQLDTLAKYGSAYKSMTENLEFLRERFVLLRGKYDEVKVDANQNITHKFVVNEAQPQEKKAYPVRWLIVVVSTMSALLLAILVIIGVENYQRFSNQIKD
jgi:uncharacterized protein involved in exopolysaccharide biosynthesis